MRRFVIFGLGTFGAAVARALFEEGHEVVVVDRDGGKIDGFRDHCAAAIRADVTDTDLLKTLDLRQAAAVVVSLGDGSVAESILTVLHLREEGAREIVAKAVTPDHARVLEMVGATQTVIPEHDMGRKVAIGLSRPNVLDYIPLGEGFSFSEIAPPDAFTGRSLRDLDIRNRYGVFVVAVKELVPERLFLMPPADYVFKGSEALLVLGRDDDLARLEGVKRG